MGGHGSNCLFFNFATRNREKLKQGADNRHYLKRILLAIGIDCPIQEALYLRQGQLPVAVDI